MNTGTKRQVFCRECGGTMYVPDVRPSSDVWTHADPTICVRSLRDQRDTLNSEVKAWTKRAMQAERELAALSPAAPKERALAPATCNYSHEGVEVCMKCGWVNQSFTAKEKT